MDGGDPGGLAGRTLTEAPVSIKNGLGWSVPGVKEAARGNLTRRKGLYYWLAIPFPDHSHGEWQ